MSGFVARHLFERSPRGSGRGLTTLDRWGQVRNDFYRWRNRCHEFEADMPYLVRDTFDRENVYRISFLYWRNSRKQTVEDWVAVRRFARRNCVPGVLLHHHFYDG
jgi:hypothetical protein